MGELSRLFKSLSDEERERIFHKTKDYIIEELKTKKEKLND